MDSQGFRSDAGSLESLKGFWETLQGVSENSQVRYMRSERFSWGFPPGDISSSLRGFSVGLKGVTGGFKESLMRYRGFEGV